MKEVINQQPKLYRIELSDGNYIYRWRAYLNPNSPFSTNLPVTVITDPVVIAFYEHDEEANLHY